MNERILSSRAALETYCRAAAAGIELGDHMTLCRVLGQWPLLADRREQAITPHLVRDGFWEAWITLAVARELKPAWHCVDVGANCGYYSVLLASRCARTLAVEPNPRPAQLLRRTAAWGAVDFEVAELAAAECSGDVTLKVPGSNSLNATIRPEPWAPGDVQEVKVQAAPLDDLVEDWPRVDFVKVDAEGAEPLVWTGMRDTLKRPGVHVLLEFSPSRYDDPAAFLREIIDFAPLRHVDYAGQILPITPDQALQAKEYVMLWLAR